VPKESLAIVAACKTEDSSKKYEFIFSQTLKYHNPKKTERNKNENNLKFKFLRSFIKFIVY
jgi:hypothetical protein